MPNPTCANCGEPTPAHIRAFTGYVTEDGHIIEKTYTGHYLCRRCYMALRPEEALDLLPDDEGEVES